MRLLVFGGGGQLGSELVHEAARRGLDLAAPQKGDVDITDADAVRDALAAKRPDVVINAAAYTKVDLAETEVAAAWRCNRDGTAVVAHGCAAACLPLVHVSTDYIFDGTKGTPYVETDPVSPLGVYGASKEAGEREARRACEKHIILRTAWVYGRHGSNFLKTMLRLAGERDSWGVVTDQLGNPTATPDLAAAILAAARRALEPDCPWGTYHFAGTGQATWHEFACAIVAAQQAITKRHPRILPITTADYPTPARRPVNSRLDSSRFASTFGVSARPWRERVQPIVRDVLHDRREAA